MTRNKMALCAVSTAFVAVAVCSNSVEDTSSDLFLVDIEALADSELGCVTRDEDNNGDCTNDGSTYFCENSWVWHDCVKGVYP